MKKVELKDLFSQKEELIGKLRVYVENNGGEEFEDEVKNTWKSEEKNINDNNIIYILKNLLITLGMILFCFSIGYIFSLMSESSDLKEKLTLLVVFSCFLQMPIIVKKIIKVLKNTVR